MTALASTATSSRWGRGQRTPTVCSTREFGVGCCVGWACWCSFSVLRTSYGCHSLVWKAVGTLIPAPPRRGCRGGESKVLALPAAFIHLKLWLISISPPRSHCAPDGRNRLVCRKTVFLFRRWAVSGLRECFCRGFVEWSLPLVERS